MRQMIHRRRRDLADPKFLLQIDIAFDHDLGLGRNGQVDRLAWHHLDIAVHDGADHLHLAPHVHVQAGEIGHDLVGRRHAEDEGDRHLVFAHRAVLVHDDVRMRRDEADQSAPRADRIGAGMAGIVEAGLRIADDVHRGHVGRFVLVLVARDRKGRPVDLVARANDLLDRAALDVLEAARRLAQPESKRLQIILRRHAERARLRATVLHQDVAQAETRLLDDVLEEDRLVALRRKRADVVHTDRLGDARDNVGIGLEIVAKRRVEGAGVGLRSTIVRRCLHLLLPLLIIYVSTVIILLFCFSKSMAFQPSSGPEKPARIEWVPSIGWASWRETLCIGRIQH